MLNITYRYTQKYRYCVINPKKARCPFSASARDYNRYLNWALKTSPRRDKQSTLVYI
jgi:hypothetical protein